MNKKLILPLIIGSGIIGLYFLVRKIWGTGSTGSSGSSTLPK